MAITSPVDQATVLGTVSVTADASDNVGVVGVQFKLDGANLGAEDTSASYSMNWDTTTATDGPHTLTAIARDGAENNTTSTPVSVTVDNAGSGEDTNLAPSATLSVDSTAGTNTKDKAVDELTRTAAACAQEVTQRTEAVDRLLKLIRAADRARDELDAARRLLGEREPSGTPPATR